MRDKNYYLRLLDQNPNAQVGFALAAAAVYAARFGTCEPSDHSSDAFKRIARDLKTRYGENLTPDDVRSEMDKPADDETRNFILRVRLTDSERERLWNDAGDSDVSDYVRRKLFK